MKAFTLLELTIVTVLLSILLGVLFQTYSVISRTAFHSQLTSNLQQETLFLMQSLQNDIDHGTITMEQKGVRSNTCIIQTKEGTVSYEKICDNKEKCGIVRKVGNQKNIMTNPDHTQIGYFQCLPLGKNSQGMRLRIHLIASKYSAIHQELQTFFQSQ